MGGSREHHLVIEEREYFEVDGTVFGPLHVADHRVVYVDMVPLPSVGGLLPT